MTHSSPFVNARVTTHDLAIVVLASNEGANLQRLLPALASELATLGLCAEVIVVDGSESGREVGPEQMPGATAVRQTRLGYGAALRDGFAAVTDAPFVVTLHADLTHSLAVLADLWRARDRADLIVASRYVSGVEARPPDARDTLSRLLNRVFSRALSVPVCDLSSGYRIYRRRILQTLPFASDDVAALPEILVRAYAEGYRVAEVPSRPASPPSGRAHARVVRFAWSYARTLWRLWRLRNSISSADYDHRAHDSVIPLQRYWQRTRYQIIRDFTPEAGRILDVGCGSSRILQDMPRAIGVDVLLRKLRFLRPVHPEVVQASVFALPFGDAVFDTVICSEVIEHIPDDPIVLGELNRVLRPGGTLVLGTPDYGRVLWHIVEWAYGKAAPGGYADEHITHFDRRGLEARVIGLGYALLDCRYVGACEMILKARKC